MRQHGAEFCILQADEVKLKLQGDVGLAMKRPHRHSQIQVPTYLSGASPTIRAHNTKAINTTLQFELSTTFRFLQFSYPKTISLSLTQTSQWAKKSCHQSPLSTAQSHSLPSFNATKSSSHNKTALDAGSLALQHLLGLGSTATYPDRSS